MFSKNVGEEDDAQDQDVGAGRDAGQPEWVQNVGHGCPLPSGTGQDNDYDDEALKNKSNDYDDEGLKKAIECSRSREFIRRHTFFVSYIRHYTGKN